MVTAKLVWFLADRNCATCGPDELRQFLHYVANGHRDERGRWGNARNKRPAKPGTVATFDATLRAFFRWCIEQEVVDRSPMDRLPKPVNRQDDVRPFTPDQVHALLAAAKRTRYPKRDFALLLFLADTACRVSEACGLTMQDLDLGTRCASVAGKGGKRRSVPVSPDTAKALWSYLRHEQRAADEPVFMTERRGAMTPQGVLSLLHRLGKAAGLSNVRCSPHTMRHFAATEFLRGGGNALALQRMLGHTALDMTRRYTAVVDADVAAQHRLASPVERLRRQKGL